jgi:peptidyl-prolyl cis-trans isomerase D
LEKAQQAKQRLAKDDFAALAKELSDDKLSAKNGGDLGLFNKGAMEPSFENAVMALKQGEVSEPIKTSFGYHLIKVTELIPGEVKPLEAVKDTIRQDIQKAEAESKFYELADKLTEVSYEHSDNLTDAAEAIGVKIEKTDLFDRTKGEGIAAEQAVRNAAFSEEVLKGNNSEPVELGNDRVVVLRMLEHHPAAARELKDVENEVAAATLTEKAQQQAVALAMQIKQRLQANESFSALAAAQHLDAKSIADMARTNETLPLSIKRAVFSAPKPTQGKPSIIVVPQPTGEQYVIALQSVKDGDTSGVDKKQLELAYVNLARTYGESEFNSVMNELQARADVIIHNKAEETR